MHAQPDPGVEAITLRMSWMDPRAKANVSYFLGLLLIIRPLWMVAYLVRVILTRPSYCRSSMNHFAIVNNIELRCQNRKDMRDCTDPEQSPCEYFSPYMAVQNTSPISEWPLHKMFQKTNQHLTSAKIASFFPFYIASTFSNLSSLPFLLFLHFGFQSRQIDISRFFPLFFLFSSFVRVGFFLRRYERFLATFFLPLSRFLLPFSFYSHFLSVTFAFFQEILARLQFFIDLKSCVSDKDSVGPAPVQGCSRS